MDGSRGSGRRRAAAGAGLALGLLAAACGPSAPPVPADGVLRVAPGRQVSLEFTMALEDGTVVDTNVGGEPLRVVIGSGRLLPALERALEGMTAGEASQVVLAPDEAYGESDPELLRTVPADRIPEKSRVADVVVMGTAPDGTQHPVRVHEVGDEEIVLDLNHPLAGKALHFDAKILAIE